MKVWSMVCGMALLAGVAMGCGGSDKKEVEEPDTVEEPEPEPEDEYMVSQEELDQIESFLARQRKFVARCWGDALAAKEVPASDAGKVSITFKIGTDGSVSNARVTQTTHKSKTLESCVLGKAERWKITRIEQAMDYSYTFGFQRL